MKPSPRTCRLPRKALEHGEEVLKRMQANKALPNVSARTRRTRAAHWFKQAKTPYKQYVLRYPALYVSKWRTSDPEANKFVNINWVDEKGRRCLRRMLTTEFEHWFVEKK